MKYEIKHRYTNEVIYTADIDSEGHITKSHQLGLAVIAALKDQVSLQYADLRGADLRYTNLSNANFSYTDLSYTDLRYTNLRYTNLSNADLRYAVSDTPYVRTLFTGTYDVTYTDSIMNIGCQSHSIADWWVFDDAAIAAMDGKKALEFWRAWKPILQSIIAAAPAQPTGYVEPVAESTH